MFSQFSFPGVTVSDTAYLRDTMRNSDATLRHHVSRHIVFTIFREGSWFLLGPF